MVTFSISSHESSKGSMNTTICNDHIGLVIVVSGALSMCICMVFMSFREVHITTCCIVYWVPTPVTGPMWDM